MQRSNAGVSIQYSMLQLDLMACLDHQAHTSLADCATGGWCLMIP